MIPTPHTSLQQNDGWGLPFSNTKFSASIAASTDTTLTVPGTAPRYKAVIKASGEDLVFMALNEAAELPAGAAFAATTSEMLEVLGTTCREVKAGDVLHFFTGSNNVEISVVFYAINGNA